jgi:hypothetical protein
MLVAASVLALVAACAPPTSAPQGASNQAHSNAASAGATSSTEVTSAASGSGGSTEPVPTGAVVTDDVPTRAEIEAAVRKLVKESGTKVAVDEVVRVRTATDSQGRFWASASVVPVETSAAEVAQIYMFLDAGKWRLHDFGTGIDDSTVPADVREQLR